ncbi:hypothetical protein NDU88_005302 [Pleurodeles waltl]|uniref:Uncharacterized protein n=1 Tax=Pleurodeles waltl TaxID=8319 RepID=A0AAV7RL38_PLEWA|nr:hypothetical protein NDU88_005302 [Pleurodeles waltl]
MNEIRGEHGGLRSSRSALERFRFRFLGARQDAAAEQIADVGTRMCAPHFLESEADWRVAGAVWWRRAALELRRARKGVAQIPLRGNRGSSSCSSGTGGPAAEKLRQGVQFKENLEKGARRKTDVKKGFANSEVNQGEIREVCANLEKKIDGVMERTQALEEAMGYEGGIGTA